RGRDANLRQRISSADGVRGRRKDAELELAWRLLRKGTTVERRADADERDEYSGETIACGLAERLEHLLLRRAVWRLWPRVLGRAMRRQRAYLHISAFTE